MSSITKALGDLRKKLAGTTGEIRNEIARLRAEMKQREHDLERAQGAPFPPEELAERMREWLRAYLDYQEHQFGQLVPLAMGPREPRPKAPGGKDEALLFMLLRETIEAAIPSFVARLGDYQWGPPTAERPALITRLTGELAELQAAEESLIDEAALNGVTIAHRHEVVQRRDAEQAKRTREEEAVAARAEREAAINKAHEEARARGRAVPSPYLRGE